MAKNPETKEEWLKYYEEKTGCKDLELAPYERVFFSPEHGFITFFAHDDILELHHMCGHGKEWQKIIVQIMEDLRLKKVRAFTRRNPDAWTRKYGGHIRGFYMEVDIDELRD